ncbi:MAG TPA: patatin-like phospholipase family protein [Planctomycetaceae bacterium]|nr:patatin-like phospholipase family protein [Planctomycetaceae bacterium]
MNERIESPNRGADQVQKTLWQSLKSPVLAALSWLNQVLKNHLLSCIVVPVGLYVIFRVPQIYNIWRQGPNRENDFTIWLLFWGYVVILAGYFLGAMLIFTAESLKGWRKAFLPVELSLSWLLKTVSTKRSAATGTIVVLTASALVGAGLWFEAFENWYSLSRIYWESTFLWLLITSIWYGCWWIWSLGQEADPDQPLSEPLRLSARFLACLFVGYLAGEIIWLLASFQVWNFSFRNYAIWGVYQTLIFFILIARGADQLSRDSKYPVRFLAMTSMVLFFFVAQPWMHHDNQIMAMKMESQEPAPGDPEVVKELPHLAEVWQAYRHYDFLIERIEQTEKYEPIVFVAASGGGSRAAIFSALILEGLAREKIAPEDPGYQKTWADQIVLISSVSGGSLASAHFVQRGMNESSLYDDGVLQSAIRTDLIQELPQAAAEVARFYNQDKSSKVPLGASSSCNLAQTIAEIENNSATFFEELKAHLTEHPGEVIRDSDAGKLGWIIDARMIDEISLDFMAPLFRGATSLVTPRGNALGDFWTDRFGWASPMAFAPTPATPEANALKPKIYPLVLLNATNVRTGSRLVASYAFRNGDRDEDGNQNAGPPRNVLLWLPDGYQAKLTLSQAVRLSSNFPFGFPAAQILLNGQDDVAILDGRDGEAILDGGNVEILDGGIIDNTGLDTIHAFFEQLIHDADPQHTKLPSRREKAERLIALLRERRIVLIEIDSGAKPEAQQDNLDRGLFSALTTPLDALNNSSYHSADISKRRYLREINEIISGHLTQSPNGSDRPSAADGLTDNRVWDAPDIRFLCNYKDESAAVMTAWALGPRDKASVIARFVLSWRKQQPLLSCLGKLFVEEKKLRDAMAALTPDENPQDVEVSAQLTKLEDDLKILSETVQSAKPEDISSIRNGIESFQQRITKLPPDASFDFKKITTIGNDLLNAFDSNDPGEYTKSKIQLQETISQQAESILSKNVADQSALPAYREKLEKLNYLKTEEAKLKNTLHELRKIDDAEQREALNRIKQSNPRN